MLKITSLAVVVLAAALAAGCASPSPQADTEPSALHTQLVQALLQAAERENRVSKVLVAPNLPPGIKKALAAHRPTVVANSLEIAGLPKGALLVHTAKLDTNQASLIARLGPVPEPHPDIGHLACGTEFTITFSLQDGEWQQGDLQILQC